MTTCHLEKFGAKSIHWAAEEASRKMASTEDDGESCDKKEAVPNWRKTVKRLATKLNSRRSWIAGMFLLGTADAMLNLTNFVYLSDDRLNYGLVIGPPSRDLWISMCLFTIVGTLFYFPETANTFSTIYSPDGETLVPIHLELIVTLCFEHIPLAIIDYFVARCRRQFTTKTATWCHAVRLVFIFVRLVWYAHMEGKKLHKNDKYQVKQVLVLFCCLLYSITIAFNIMNWYSEPDTDIRHYHLQDVSVFLLNHPPPPEILEFNITLTDVLMEQSGKGRNMSNAWLTMTLIDFYINIGVANFSKSVMANYSCSASEKKPEECGDAKWLGFRFIYGLSDWSPFGEIRYNFAYICPKGSKNSAESCRNSDRVLRKPWSLYFYEAHWSYEADNVTLASVNVSAPFRKAYTHPRPMPDPTLSVCSHMNLTDFDCGWD